MPTISYAVTACNEAKELELLLHKLLAVVRPDDEIILQIDQDKVSPEVQHVFSKISSSDKNVHSNLLLTTFKLDRDFAAFKNNLKDICKKDYIFFIDADEYPSENVLHHLPVVLESNPVDLFVIPRVNTVTGLTMDHINKWGWRVDDRGRINWPDYQTRIVKNRKELKWEGKVHEKIIGFKTITHFPFDNEDWCLYHPKDIERQERQNQFYNTL